MADVVDKATRGRMMAGIRVKHTKPEMLVRKALFAAGYRFRLHRKDLPGVPDVVLPGRRIAIFVHGCFWHRHRGCRLSKLPESNAEFWRAKLSGNIYRDKRAVKALRAADWRVLVVWECATRRNSIQELSANLSDWIAGDAPFGEITDSIAGRK